MRTWNLSSLFGRLVGGVALLCAASPAIADSISANATVTNVSADTGVAPGSFVLSAAAPVLTIPAGDFNGADSYDVGSVLEFRVAPGFRFNAAALPTLTPDDPELVFDPPVFVNGGLITVRVDGIPNPAADVNVTITNFDIGIDPASPDAATVANAGAGLFPVELSRPFLAGPPAALLLMQIDTVAGVIPTGNSSLQLATAGDIDGYANGTDPCNLIFRARDLGNNPIVGLNVSLERNDGNLLPGTIVVNPVAGAQTTNASGNINYALTTSTPIAGLTPRVVAGASNFDLPVALTFLPVPILDLSILGAATAAANGTDPIVLQVRARDAASNPLANLNVSLLLDGGIVLPGSITVAAPGANTTTDALGIATFSITSDTPSALTNLIVRTVTPLAANPNAVVDSTPRGIQFVSTELGIVITSITPSPLVSGSNFTLNFEIRDENGAGELASVTGLNLAVVAKVGNGQVLGTCTGCTGFNGTSGSITGLRYVTDTVPESGVQLALVATNQSIGSDCSNNLTVNAAAGRSLQFDTQPQSVTGNQPINPTPIAVSLRDGGGSLVTNEPGDVLLELRRNGANAAGLSGVVIGALANGVATFAGNLTVSDRNIGYTLRASTTGASGDSATFSTAGLLEFAITNINPSPLIAGQPFTLDFEVRDAAGDPFAVSNVDLQLAVKQGNGVLENACVGCTGFSGSNGSITGLAYETALVPETQVQLTLVATNESIGSACTADLTVNPDFGVGTEPRIIFATQPLPLVQVNGPLAASGQPIRLAIVDLGDRRVATLDTQTVSIALLPNDGALVAPTTRDRAIVDGEVSYNDLSVNTIANGFTLRATAPAGVNPNTVDSTPFDVLPGADLQATGVILDAAVVDGALSGVRVQYSIIGASVGAFNIEVGYDINGNGLIDAGESAGSVPANVLTPGTFEQAMPAGLVNDLRTLMDATEQNGRNVLAVVDAGGDVDFEASEFDPLAPDAASNNIARRALSVDIIAESAVLVGTSLRVIYRVNALATVPPFSITATRDPAPGLLMADQTIADIAGRAPGRRAIDIPLALPAGAFIRNADTIIARVNASGAPVGELTDANNLGFSAPIFVDVNIRDVRVDAVAAGGSACPNALRAAIQYTVDSPFAVEPFSIALSSNGAALGIPPFVGDFTPGSHDFAARVDEQIVALGQADGRAIVVQAATVAADADAPNNSRNSNSTTFGVDVSVQSFTFDGRAIGERIPAVKVPVLVEGTRVPVSVTLRLIAEFVRVDGGTRTTFTKNLGANGQPLAVTINVNCPTGGNNPIEFDFGAVTVARDAIFASDNYALRAELDPAFADAFDINAANDSRNAQNVIGAGDRDDDGDGLTAAEESAGSAFVTVRSARDVGAGASSQVRAVDRGETFTSDQSLDSDGDGIEDADEYEGVANISSAGVIYFTNPAEADTDADGLTDFEEIFTYGTDPTNWDTDVDLLSDLEEINGFAISEYTGRTSGLFDPSRTLTVATDPLLFDTDADGISDWSEINTWARSNADRDGDGEFDAVQSIDLEDIAARRDSDGTFSAVSGKSLRGVRTNPISRDTDGDNLPDATDPAPQINPANWGFDQNGDGVFDLADIAALRQAATDAGGNADEVPATVEAFQQALLNFDLDGDGFLEAPDTNADGFPDFTRYNEATIEQLFGIDFSNDGSLDDGYDVGDPELGSEGPNETRDEAFNFGRILFGRFRVQSGGSGTLEVNERLTSGVSQLFATDNCPTQANAEQLDFDADGLGDDCDNDRDNDGVENRLDPVDQNPTLSGGGGGVGMCGFGAVQALALSLLGLALVRGGRPIRIRRSA